MSNINAHHKELNLYALLLLSVIALFYLLYKPLLTANAVYPLAWANNGSTDFFDIVSSFVGVGDTGWFSYNPFRGYPLGADYASYPNADLGNRILIWAIVLFTKNPITVFNIYVFISYLLVAVVSYAAITATQNGTLSGKIFALVLALFFAFAPYHFYRVQLGHLYLANYACVPLTFLAVNRLKGRALAAICGLIVSGFGIYYSVYSFIIALLFIIKRVMSGDNNKSATYFSYGLAFFAFSQLLFSVLHQNRLEVVVNRGLIDSYTFGLRPILMLLPALYESTSSWAIYLQSLYGKGWLNENVSSALGSCMLFLLLFCALLLFVCPSARQVLRSRAVRFELIIVALFVVLFSSDILNLLVGYLSLGMLRSNTRASIYIEFVLILIAFRIIASSHLAYQVIPTILVVSLLYHSVYLSRSQTRYVFDAYDRDTMVVKKLDSISIPEKNIFNLPYIPYPEAAVGQVSYQHLVMTLAKNTKISYGALRGTKADSLYRHLSSMKISEAFFSKLISAGYNLLSLDVRGYDKASADSLISSLNHACSESYVADSIYIYSLSSCRHIVKDLPSHRRHTKRNRGS